MYSVQVYGVQKLLQPVSMNDTNPNSHTQDLLVHHGTCKQGDGQEFETTYLWETSRHLHDWLGQQPHKVWDKSHLEHGSWDHEVSHHCVVHGLLLGLRNDLRITGQILLYIYVPGLYVNLCFQTYWLDVWCRLFRSVVCMSDGDPTGCQETDRVEKVNSKQKTIKAHKRWGFNVIWWLYIFI